MLCGRSVLPENELLYLDYYNTEASDFECENVIRVASATVCA